MRATEIEELKILLVFHYVTFTRSVKNSFIILLDISEDYFATSLSVLEANNEFQCGEKWAFRIICRMFASHKTRRY